MTIVHISDDLKKEFSIDSEGKATVTIRGAARLLDIDEAAIRKSFESASAELKPLKLAVTLIQYGFEPAELKCFLTAGIPDAAFAIIAQYYASLAGRYCTKAAATLCCAFTAIGFRFWVQSELGYKQQSEQPLVAPTGAVYPVLCKKSYAFDMFKDWGNALIMEDFDSNVKLPNPIKTYKELGQYLVAKAMALTDMDVALGGANEPKAILARLTMAGKPIDPNLLSDFDAADKRPGIKKQFVSVTQKVEQLDLTVKKKG